MSIQQYFINDYDHIKKAVWFIEKNNGINVDDSYIDEWNQLNELYNKDQTVEIYKKLYLHYPSTLTLLRILHPEIFDQFIINYVYNKVTINNCINTNIINLLVTAFSEILNWNSTRKELYLITKDKYNESEISLKWVKVSNNFDMYLIELLEKIIVKIDNDNIDSKIEKELLKLPQQKYINLFYSKNAYKRHANNTNNFTENSNDIMIFKNGYIDIKTGEFNASICNVYEDNEQCMNINFDNYDESSCSKDTMFNYILSMMNKMFYNKIPKIINLVYGSTSVDLLILIEKLFGSYVYHTTMKEYMLKHAHINNKFIFIDVTSDISLNLVYNNLHENQYMFINCSNNHFPKMNGVLDSYKFSILCSDNAYIRNYNIENFLADIIYSDQEIDEPFMISMLKENMKCESNSAEYFCKAQIIYDDNSDITYTETAIYKEYIKFCKVNKLTINSQTGFFNILITHNINSEGDIGSRVFSGFTLNNV